MYIVVDTGGQGDNKNLLSTLKLIAKSITIDLVNRYNTSVYSKVYKPKDYENNLDISTSMMFITNYAEYQLEYYKRLMFTILHEYEPYYKKGVLRTVMSSIFLFPIVEELVENIIMDSSIGSIKKNDCGQIQYKLELYDDIVITELIPDSYFSTENNKCYLNMGLDYYYFKKQSSGVYIDTLNNIMHSVKIKFKDYYYYSMKKCNFNGIIIEFDKFLNCYTVNTKECINELCKYLKENDRLIY